MRRSFEKHERQYRIIYEELYRDFRIFVKDLADSLEVTRNTARKRLDESLKEGYIILPQIRRRPFKNFKEYMIFANCENPLHVYKQLKEDRRVVHHAVIAGFANLWVVSKEKIDIEGDILFEGIRSDYYVAYALPYSWDQAIQKMKEKLESFVFKDYTPKGIIKTHWNEQLEWWDSEFETLFKEFKYNGRKNFTSIMKKHNISAEKIYKFIEVLPYCCTVFTRYFPKGISAYDPYLFMFETDYEDFVIDLFSLLPTSPFFFKAADNLFVYAYVEKASVRETGPDITDIGQIKLLCLVDDLKKRGIIKKEAHAIFEYHWSKNL